MGKGCLLSIKDSVYLVLDSRGDDVRVTWPNLDYMPGLHPKDYFNLYTDIFT